jgi:tetratricopeptide (TPR) repeat protein
MREDIAIAIRQRNLPGIMRLFFEGNPPNIRLGFKLETDLWDFKPDCPPLGQQSDNAWAHVASDVLAFHNNRGGLLFFGFTNDFRFRGASTVLDSKMVNDRLRRYLPDTIWVDYCREFIQHDQRYLGVALIPPRGPSPARFKSSAPRLPSLSERPRFEKDGSARREGDSTLILSKRDASEWIRSLSVPTVGRLFEVDEPMFRILVPEYERFVHRSQLCNEVERSLRDPRVSVTSLTGVGGMGKTALATWAALEAYQRDQFEFIVSITAKDRELTATGIVGLQAGLTSFERLLDAVSDVLGVSDLKEVGVIERETEIRALLGSGRGLLYVDNLETVDDVRIIQFLDSLPLPTRALVTSRRSRVRVASQPVDVSALADPEILEFIKTLLTQEAFRHVAGLKDPEILRIGQAWDGIPLAIRWSLSRAHSPAEALANAEAVAHGADHGDELLEFSFRRVFESLTELERNVLHVLTILQQAIPIEAVCVGVGDSNTKVLDAVESLTEDALVRRLFDSQRNDVAYTVLPITRSFVRKDLARSPNIARRTTKALTDWFEARDVADGDQRVVVREIRQGGSSDDTALLDLATGAERRGDLDGAERFYKQALERSPRSWQAARRYAEFQRHLRRNLVEALRLYRQAAANAPSQGPDRALIFREWGVLLRQSGEPNASVQAEAQLRIALKETPNDVIALGALASLLHARGAHGPLISLIEPHIGLPNQKFRQSVLPLLLEAYDRSRQLVKAATLRRTLEHEKLGQYHAGSPA